MAKRKPAGKRSRTATTLAPDKVGDKIATLRKYYDLGLRALGKSADGSDRKPETIADLAKEAGVSAGTIRKGVMFARSYSRVELNELLALRNPKGEPLAWYFVRVLLQIKDKAQRHEIQKRVAEGGWSREDLWDEIHARSGGTRPAPKGGRKFALPWTPEQSLRRLVERCESWLRFYENIGGVGGLAYQVRSASESGKPSAGLKELVRQARTKSHEVQEVAREVADQLRKLEPKIKGERAGGMKPTKPEADHGGKSGVGSRSRPKR